MSEEKTSNIVEQVKAFNLAAGNTVDQLNIRQMALYFGLQLEELGEKLKHVGMQHQADYLTHLSLEFRSGKNDYVLYGADLTAILDDDIDIMVVTVGSLLSQGADIHGAINEVDRANMSKIWPDGKMHRDPTGKVEKPEGWVGPDLSPFVTTE